MSPRNGCLCCEARARIYGARFSLAFARKYLRHILTGTAPYGTRDAVQVIVGQTRVAARILWGGR